MLNVFVKSFLTRIGQSVLLEIFCARLTQRTWSLGTRKVGSGRLRTVRTEQNIERLAELSLICSQEDNPGSSKSLRDIEKLTATSCSSVRWITKTDLQCSFMSSASVPRDSNYKMSSSSFRPTSLYQEKGCDAKRICKEFSNKNWAVSS